MANACNGKLKLVLVSQSYDLKDLQQRLSHSGINRMVYVLDTSYSKHYNHALKQLFTAVRKGASYYDYGYNEFLMRNDSVVYVRDGRQTDAEFTTVLKSIADGNPAPLQPQFYPKKKHSSK